MGIEEETRGGLLNPAGLAPLPLYQVSIVNRLTFSWMDRLFRKGWKHPLVFDDLYQIPKRLHTETLANSFFIEWEKQLAAHLNRIPANKETGKRPNPDGKLLRAVVWTLAGKQILSLGIMLVLANLSNLFAPYFVQWILDFTINRYTASLGAPGATAEPLSHGLGLVFGLLILQVVGSFLSNHFIQESAVSAISLRTMMTSVIYRKSLKLASSARQEYTSGNVVNLISTDTNRVEMFINQANYCWTIPLSLAINIAFLINSLGWPAICGVGLLFASAPFQAYLFSLMMKIRGIMAPITGRRVNLTTEVLSGVRVIKFFAWENAFVNKVAGIRESEIALVLRRSKLMAFIMTQGQPLFMLPMVLNTWAEFNVGLRRIEAFLLAAEVESDPVVDPTAEYGILIENGQFEWAGDVYSHGFDKPKAIVQKGRSGPPGGPGSPGGPSGPRGLNSMPNGKISSKQDLIFDPTTASHVSSLKNINLKIKKGDLVAVVGAVGSGKSSLLNALIGEMKTVSGTVTFSGSLSYAAQTAWIQNATVKENVVFGKAYDKLKYLHALVDSALLPDMKVLQDADQTSIGERGINLSGGQKQRVNMARLLYCDSDIVLIDDPLSAVDAH
ncbi:hypothetical protein HK100_008695, partial [Physocladia obscura]